MTISQPMGWILYSPLIFLRVSNTADITLVNSELTQVNIHDSWDATNTEHAQSHLYWAIKYFNLTRASSSALWLCRLCDAKDLLKHVQHGPQIYGRSSRFSAEPCKKQPSNLTWQYFHNCANRWGMRARGLPVVSTKRPLNIPRRVRLSLLKWECPRAFWSMGKGSGLMAG